MKIVYTKEEVATIIAKEVEGITKNKISVKFETYRNNEFATVTIETAETEASNEPSDAPSE